ncbi:CDP-alcohol phosphatidyltransferase family protein [Acidobacteriota bacterium]
MYLFVQLFTIFRIPLAVTFGIIFLTTSSQLSLIVCLALLLLIEATDLFDGPLARKFNVASEFGATLDPFSDSISRLIIYFSFAYNDYVIFFVPVSMAIRDIIVAYSRIILAQRGKSVSAKISGKIKAMVQSTGSFFILLGPFYWGEIGSNVYYFLSWLIITVTLLSSVQYGRSAIQAVSESNRTGED